MRTLVSADRVFGHDADAVLIESGRIRAVGRRADLSYAPAREERFPGGTIVPGLRDAHVHPVGYTSALHRLNLNRIGGFEELIDVIRTAHRDLPASEPLIGVRLDDGTLDERRLPTRLDLDRAALDRAVLLYRYCGHVAVTNTAGLAAAAVDASTPDPPGGSLDRDRDGTPTGVLRETAVQLVSAAVGDRAAGLTPAQVVESSRLLAATGLTSLGAMVATGAGLWCEGSDELGLLIDAAPELAVPMTVWVATDDPAELAMAAERLERSGRRLHFGGVKLFADGSLGGHTAAMFEPYADHPASRGTLRLPASAAVRVARRAIELGGGVAIHAIGDAAIDHTLGIFERLLDGGADPSGLRMEHVSVVRDEDLVRLARLGVTASVQPAFLASEGDMLPARLGPQRVALAYRFEAMRRLGIPLAGGSDCPVEPPHPLHGIAAATDRFGINPAEALTLDDAIAAFTAGAARALRQPSPLDPGSPGHLTIIDGDPSAMEPTHLRAAGVLATFIDGSLPEVPYGTVDWVG